MSGYCTECGEEFRTEGWLCKECADALGVDPRGPMSWVVVGHVKAMSENSLVCKLKAILNL